MGDRARMRVLAVVVGLFLVSALVAVVGAVSTRELPIWLAVFFVLVVVCLVLIGFATLPDLWRDE